jgi:DNA-3-methyladenine glycosylase II
VIGQQLSNSSARAIRSKFDILFENDGIDPQRLAGTNEEELRKTGLSLAKARCLRSLAEHVLSNKINFLKLEAIDDEAIISTLTQVKGIGRWTAEMYLMFSLGRLDVFPIDDLAIQNAIIRIYDIPKAGFNAHARKIADQWRPFRTIACWYLYRYLDMIRSNKG